MKFAGISRERTPVCILFSSGLQIVDLFYTDCSYKRVCICYGRRKESNICSLRLPMRGWLSNIQKVLKYLHDTILSGEWFGS